MRFSIRDILLLTVIVAVLTGWGLDRWRLVKCAAELQQRSDRLLYEAEMARALALVERQTALLQTERARVVQESQQQDSEPQQPEGSANEADK